MNQSVFILIIALYNKDGDVDEYFFGAVACTAEDATGYTGECSEWQGISRGMLSNYELGTREPDFAMLCHIADYYAVTTDYLLGRSDEMRGSVSSPESEIWNQVTLLSKPKSAGSSCLYSAVKVTG